MAFVQADKIRRRPAVLALVIAALLASVAWIERAPLLYRIGVLWVTSDPLTPADAIVVLGGDFEVRPFAAAALYKRGLAPIILVSNVRLGPAERRGFVPTHTELNRDVLLKLDVPAAAIADFGKGLSSTQEEAAAIGRWALQSGARKIIVPTELFASRRTSWIFDRELSPIGVHVMVATYPAEEYSLTDWWQYRSGFVDFNNEILKYLYYQLRF